MKNPETSTEANKTSARKRTRRRPMITHETLPVSGASVVGMPRAALSAGWRPRNLHGAKLRRPALPEGPAALEAGWRLHRGELEPGEDDKTLPTVASPKVARPRQDRQRRRMGVTQATPRLDQSASRSPPHERIQGKREGICFLDAGPKGKATL
jgi:hypothetical protein